MSILAKLFSESPFRALSEHTQKVHDCVGLVRPIVDALLNGDYDKASELHDVMSKTEHEADVLKTTIRDMLSSAVWLSIKRDDLARYLAYQDDVADAAEDFSVVVSLRRTEIHPDLKEDLLTFVDQVIKVSEEMLDMATKLGAVAHGRMNKKDADEVLNGALRLGEEEWKADRLQRRFARHCYQLEGQVGTMDLVFYDKYCTTLSAIANKAENTGKFLHMLIAHQ